MMSFQLSNRAKGLAPKLAPHAHGIISFGAGDASPELMPDLTAEAQLALTLHRPETLQYAASRLGLEPLRAWLCDYLRGDGVTALPEQIIVVNGAKHGLDLACRLLTEEGDCVVVTAPTYFTGIPIFRSNGLTFLEAPQDEEGMSVQFLHNEFERRRSAGQPLPKLIYDVPDFHNPTGLCMSERRRMALIELAASHAIPIVEDSPYRHVRFDGAPIPSLKSLDRHGCVIQVGTFAKLLAPGLRIGWVVTTEENAARMGQLKSDGGSCPLTQRIILEYCASGKLPAQLDRVRRTYRAHRDAMIAALREHVPNVSFRVPEGGYYIWARLPATVDAQSLTKAALARGVEVVPGTRFFADAGPGYPANASPGSGFVRLAFSFSDVAAIRDGVAKLATAIQDADRSH